MDTNELASNCELDLFGQDVSVETLDAYMSDNFEGESQASIMALLAATLL